MFLRWSQVWSFFFEIGSLSHNGLQMTGADSETPVWLSECCNQKNGSLSQTMGLKRDTLFQNIAAAAVRVSPPPKKPPVKQWGCKNASCSKTPLRCQSVCQPQEMGLPCNNGVPKTRAFQNALCGCSSRLKKHQLFKNTTAGAVHAPTQKRGYSLKEWGCKNTKLFKKPQWVHCVFPPPKKGPPLKHCG